MTAQHRRLEDAQILCSAAGLPQPSSPNDPQVLTAAELIQKILGYQEEVNK